MNCQMTRNATIRIAQRISARLPKYRTGDRIGRPHLGQAHAMGEIWLPQSGHDTSAMMNRQLGSYFAFFIPCANFTASATPLSLATALTLALSAPLRDFRAPMYCP